MYNNDDEYDSIVNVKEIKEILENKETPLDISKLKVLLNDIKNNLELIDSTISNLIDENEDISDIDDLRSELDEKIEEVEQTKENFEKLLQVIKQAYELKDFDKASIDTINTICYQEEMTSYVLWEHNTKKDK
jgi:hypothetical protein